MATKKQQPKKDITDVLSSIDGLKTENTNQFAAVNRSIGGIEKRLDNHHGRIKELEEDKLKRKAADEAVAEYKRDHNDSWQSGYNKNGSGNTIEVNKELLKAIGLLVTAIGILVAGYAVTKK